MTFLLRLAATAAVVSLGGRSPAQSAPTITSTATRLASCLRVIVAEDHGAPVFSIVAHYTVGSRDERKGEKKGLPH